MDNKFDIEELSAPVVKINGSADPNVTFFGGSEEMLKITPEAFYVRGVKVEVDNKEAKQVYNAFHSWLVWAGLTQNHGN